LEALAVARTLEREPEHNFGHGGSAAGFQKILLEDNRWKKTLQKEFVDIPVP